MKMQNNNNRKYNRYCNAFSSPKKLNFGFLIKNTSQVLFGRGCDMRYKVIVLLMGVVLSMLSTGAIAGGGGSGSGGTGWGTTPATGTVMKNGQLVSSRLGFEINSNNGSMRLRGGCYFNSNQTDQNFSTTTNGRYERTVTM